ncbi:VOC family protein [Algoriphagus sp. CAU 1675]|uniref:VOC family protein n=1 Tax=Algoriphagus sp. CAU 1675 TaxID=3032597 RepID=UPI0023DA9712|nr:VOC family protein [Algoriphagus sp. CAU 1675]MDF2159152.1 VOC family protein [Algoriphagus sp. CAU 1675]
MKSVTLAYFEIPVRDMDRAISFYQKVFDCHLNKQVLGDFQMAMFPMDSSAKGAGGSLVYQKEFYEPSPKAGTLVYFSSEDCDVELGRVEEAGGKLLYPKRMISPEVGYMGVFFDTEGNRVAVFSQK